MFLMICSFFFFNDTATTEIYTLSLHDALPICPTEDWYPPSIFFQGKKFMVYGDRSEEHTSELQSRLHLVCRLLLEKKKKKRYANITHQYRPQNLQLPKTTREKSTTQLPPSSIT